MMRMLLVVGAVGAGFAFRPVAEGRGVTRMRVASEEMNLGVEAFAAAKDAVEAARALRDIYDALPHSDLELEMPDPAVTAEFKVEAFKALARRQGDPEIWSPENVASFKQLRSELDPFRTQDLVGYLRIGPLVGGVYYVAALAVQWFLPEIFPAVYVFLAAVFAAPFVYTILLS